MEGLGSLSEKAARLETLGVWLAAELAPDARDDVKRAALLCKTDLLSEMIGSGKEYASLEGIMGGHYARRAGEREEVARAIAEHYRPRGPSDALPSTDAAAVLALADKLDHVSGAFVAGKVPSGSEDPFAVRRAGNGAVRILLEQKRFLNLHRASMQATAPFFAADPELPHAQIMKQLGEFWRGRVAGLVAEPDESESFAPDTVEAAMESRSTGRPGWADPYDCLLRSRILHGFRGDARFQPLVILFKRVANILAKATETLPPGLDREKLTEKVERDLADALDRTRTRTEPLWSERRYAEILPAFLGMENAIHAFFDGVMVNVEDPPVRLNRLKLLSEVRELFVRGWDLSKVVAEGEKI
jgi:glycyl-tRNA synthetase beta chain